ncbi:BCAM0308 family protein [Candidatus Oleimmundimicrobium sp.]|uniref:BCAM0308 family protein n=1 Tax=Candidatus Oleimmundimicrobium sp. TaxID=3060597 RepID=UPI00272327C2|nr:BCAM0308 family protein [Candidatus Oleimmundimicrobium sp.]MDO8886017.1 BCAM0308 family protein [Candidatus Oleimmundimicrobium sp.]
MMKLCSSCEAVFDGRKWVYDENLYEKLSKKSDVEMGLCLGCEKLKKKMVDGVVLIKGDFIKNHKDEALNLIHNTVEKKKKRNVAARIFKMGETPEGFSIETTDKALAELIGREFERAFSGKLDIQWLEGEKFVRVNWERS